MKKPVILSAVFAVLAGLTPTVSAAEETHQPYPVVWSLTEGIQAPESACLDPVTGDLFLSQIGGGGGKAKDGDGWISRLTVEGKMLKNRWVTGLSAPKGIRTHGDMLWVSDIDQVVGISISEERIVRRITIPDAKFLNDVATGRDGTVYVSDMVAGIVYALNNGRVRAKVQGSATEHPNGLLVHGGSIYLAGWGRDLQDDFSTKRLGRLLAFDLKTGKGKVVTKQPLGNLDGLEIDGRGGFIVTDWRAGKVFRINAAGQARELIRLPRGTADHAFLTDKKWLILPEMLENKVSAIDLSKAIK